MTNRIFNSNVLRRLDSNERPQGYEPCELPTAPLRDVRRTPFLFTGAKLHFSSEFAKHFSHNVYSCVRFSLILNSF